MATLVINKTYQDGQVLGEENLDNSFNSIAAWANNKGIGGDNIQDNSIGPSEIQTSAITASKIAENAVTTPKIADGAVTLAKLAAAVIDRLVPVGSIRMWGADSAPAGYLLCDGSAVSRVTYSNLFALYGVAHGQGDGTTTFNLPDMRGRMPRGVNNGAVDADRTGSGSASDNAATFNNHRLVTGQLVKMTGGALTGLTPLNDYYVIYVNDNTVAFATSYANAVSNTRIAISGSNTATIAPHRDAGSLDRAAPGAGGNTGDNVGSVQLDDFRARELRLNIGTYTGSGNWVIAGRGNLSNTLSVPVATSSDQPGNETRSDNVYVNFIVKV